MRMTKFLAASVILAGGLLSAATLAAAYDGTNCKAPGNCWEPKPGYPATVKGSKYDPKHDPNEIVKPEKAIKAMEERNAKRVTCFKKTGKFVYDVSKLSC